MPTTNSTIQFKHGLQETFSSITKDSNTIYFITDTNRLFVGDSEYTRPVQHGSELPTSKNPANSLFVKETGTSRELYYSKDGTAWDMIAYLPATITGGVFGDNTAGTVAYGGTVKVPKVTVDNRGHVTAVEDVNVTLPASDKVTTVTTSGDGNAVTSGSISVDGTTLTLTKGQEFVPAYGITATQESYSDGPHSGMTENTLNLLNLITMRQGRDNNYTSSIDPSINFTISPTVPDISTTGTPSASIVVNKGYVDNGRFIYKGTIGTNGDFSSIDDALDYVKHGSRVCAVKGSLYLITSNMTLEQSKACIMNNGYVSNASNDISLHAGDFIVVVQSTENYTYQSGDYVEPGYYYLSSVSNVKFIVIPASSTHVSSIKIAGSGDTINVSTSSQKGELILGSAAGVNTTSTVTNDATTVPTTSAVKTYVDDAVAAATLTWKTL